MFAHKLLREGVGTDRRNGHAFIQRLGLEGNWSLEHIKVMFYKWILDVFYGKLC